MLNHEELKKLSITDLISLMNYLGKRSQDLTNLVNLSTKGSDVRTIHENCYGACLAIYFAVREEITERCEKIYSDHRIEPKIEICSADRNLED